MSLASISRELSDAVDALSFAPPVTHVYNPLTYARTSHERFLETYGSGAKEALFLGMNPGPFGMAQTGVPFGDVGFVRDWMKIDAEVARPSDEHPKRPIQGFECARSEVSGSRLWGWAKERFTTPDAFFARFFVTNYCPLVFMEESGRNRVPEKLPKAERTALYEVCDAALRKTVLELQPPMLIGVGKFAADRAKVALEGIEVSIAWILHPSPASPRANRGWAPQAEKELKALGIDF
ncbi:MAG: uracil-DNA glycosylase family protein [Myxococcota bacterium]